MGGAARRVQWTPSLAGRARLRPHLQSGGAGRVACGVRPETGCTERRRERAAAQGGPAPGTEHPAPWAAAAGMWGTWLQRTEGSGPEAEALQQVRSLTMCRGPAGTPGRFLGCCPQRTGTPPQGSRHRKCWDTGTFLGAGPAGAPVAEMRALLPAPALRVFALMSLP